MALDKLQAKWDNEARKRGVFKCKKCGSDRWVAASLNGGLTRVRQCVPCGTIGEVIEPEVEPQYVITPPDLDLTHLTGKTEDVNAEQPQDGNNVFTNGETLEPVEAHKFSMCSLCHSYVEHGESIVTADGTAWVHEVCARREGWPVAGDA